MWPHLTAVISHDGEVWMWGSNQNCQLGLGSTLKEAPRPTNPVGTELVSASAREASSCNSWSWIVHRR